MNTGLKQLETLKRTAPQSLSISEAPNVSVFEPQLDWWLALWELLIECSQEGSEASIAKDCQRLQAVSFRLVGDVLPRYSRACLLFQGATKSRDRSAIDLDLLRSYHRLTRFLCGFARKVWPEVDLRWLAPLA